jgi:hypothetical protein
MRTATDRTEPDVVAQPLTTPAAALPSIWPTILPPLVYAFASIFVPYLGWLGGAVLIATSRRWGLRTKLFSILAPLGATVIYLVATTASRSYSSNAPGEQFDSPSGLTGPLGVSPVGLFGSFYVLAGASFIAGIWLLAIALRRSDRASATGVSRA